MRRQASRAIDLFSQDGADRPGVRGVIQGRHKSRVGIVGLGIGTLAAYSEAGQQWTFFEIDPAIANLASDSRQFTYLSDSPARTRIVLGDARIALTKEPARSFDVLVVDAFSSDAVPVHLLTREALQLYLQKLDAGGIIAFNITNSYLQLTPLIADLGHDAGLVVLVSTMCKSMRPRCLSGRQRLDGL